MYPIHLQQIIAHKYKAQFKNLSALRNIYIERLSGWMIAKGF